MVTMHHCERPTATAFDTKEVCTHDWKFTAASTECGQTSLSACAGKSEFALFSAEAFFNDV